jgi:RES domain-containing protein
MFVFRIVKSKSRTKDLSGTGSFKYGGRWNNKGTFMLYTSINASLALLESLVHFDPAHVPPHLYLVQIEVDDKAPVLILEDVDYPSLWKDPELPENKILGDKWMNEMKHLAIGVRSAVNESELNYLLNPLFPGYNKYIKLAGIMELPFDKRLLN